MFAVEYKVTRVSVTPDVSIVYGDDWLSIQDFAADEDGNATVTRAELPALLDRLQAAAEAMGVATKQGEMVKALGLAVEYMTTIACDPNHLVLTECRKALASVKR